VKQFSAAILMFIFLFNLVGYRFVVDYMQKQSDEKLEVCLDNKKYNESQLIEIKIPVNLAYQTSWSQYERYDGQVNLNGITYKYVKRKLCNDTLYLKCIPNTQRMQLQAAKNEFFKNNNDITQNNSSKKSDNSKSVTLKKMITEYDEQVLPLNTNFLFTTQKSYWLYLQNRIINSVHISPEQPPDSLIG
jgi:hypothetical protein